MRDSGAATRRSRLSKILLSDTFRVHTVEYRATDGEIVKRSIEVLETREETVLFLVLGGPDKAKFELPYKQFVRINEVKV